MTISDQIQTSAPLCHLCGQLSQPGVSVLHLQQHSLGSLGRPRQQVRILGQENVRQRCQRHAISSPQGVAGFHADGSQVPLHLQPEGLVKRFPRLALCLQRVHHNAHRDRQVL